MTALFSFDNSYARDLTGCYAPWQLRATPQARWIKVNTALASTLDLTPQQIERLQGEEGLALFAGRSDFVGAAPLAQAYAGHQFGHFSAALGDGRALLIGEIIDAQGMRQDLALKGSGTTPFSRGGDGKAALGPMLREYLMSEALHALGVPTTRSLGVLDTGEAVRRAEGLLPGAVLIRVASSHLRVGTFEFFAARQQTDLVEKLVRYSLARHYPDIPTQGQSPAEAALTLLQAVVQRQAQLIAQWMGLGFIHGVMNSDNMTISGQTIDYGPCAFMNAHDPATVFSSIDRQGRYAYGQQAAMGAWNVARLAESLLGLMQSQWSQDEAIKRASAAVLAFESHYAQAQLDQMRAKLGFGKENAPTEAHRDQALAAEFLRLLHQHRLDHTRAFRGLYEAVADEGQQGLVHLQPACAHENTQDNIHDLSHSTDWIGWYHTWQTRFNSHPVVKATRLEAMRRANPLYIPRNHLVEAALTAASVEQNLAPFERLLAVLQHPFEARLEDQAYALAPTREEQAGYQTFCGT